MKKLLCVDGNSLLNRAFYGVKPLTTRDGKNTNATFGFIKMLNNHLQSVKPDYAAIAFDLKKPTFRHEKCDFYKANRKGMPTELAEQLEDSKNAAQLLGFHMLTKEGFEADDILGTLSEYGRQGIQVYLLTGDRDSYQLVGENVKVLYLSTNQTTEIDEKAVYEKYGVKPRSLIEVKALMGDSSDNIPGVKGIGEKTALDLIKRFETVENLYNCLETADGISKSVKTKLEEDKEMAFVSRFLAEIVKNVPLETSLEQLEYKGVDKTGLLALCESLELESIIKNLDLRQTDEQMCLDNCPLEYTGIQSVSQIEEKEFSLWISTENKKIYVCVDDDKKYVLEENGENLRQIFCDNQKNIILHDVKQQIKRLREYGINEIESKFYDVMLASYVVDPSSVVSEESLISAYGTAGINLEDIDQKGLLCASNLHKLKSELDAKIKNNSQEYLLYEVEFPLAIVLEDMENEGFKINKKALEDYGKELDERINSRQESIYALAGVQFNINSPKQLGEVLFEKMMLLPVKKTKSGYSTDAESLEKLRAESPIIDQILEYRTVSKLKSTYADGLLKALGEDGRLHTNFKQALTLTGRLSSAEPNLQNIPIRTHEGREIRKVFIPESNKVLVDADYSQIELRVMAAISKDENMLATYREGKDIHTMTASQVFDVPEQDVTAEMRSKAKAINFGIIYGISDFSLAGDMKVSKKEASEYIKRYFEKYPSVKAYLDSVKTKAKQDGFVTTFFGRRRYIPELSSRIFMQRAFGERVAMNAPIQGTAADIIKIAMLRVYNALKEEKLDAKLILQVHDELILECSKKDAQKAKEILVREMSKNTGLDVTLDVTAQTGENWEECHG